MVEMRLDRDSQIVLMLIDTKSELLNVKSRVILVCCVSTGPGEGIILVSFLDWIDGEMDGAARVVAINASRRAVLWTFRPEHNLRNWIGFIQNGSIVFSDAHGAVYRLRFKDGWWLWIDGWPHHLGIQFPDWDGAAAGDSATHACTTDSFANPSIARGGAVFVAAMSGKVTRLHDKNGDGQFEAESSEISEFDTGNAFQAFSCQVLLRTFLVGGGRRPFLSRYTREVAWYVQATPVRKRRYEEGIGIFLVRETLVHEEFTEALIRLHEEKCGVSQEFRDFGLPEESLWRLGTGMIIPGQMVTGDGGSVKMMTMTSTSAIFLRAAIQRLHMMILPAILPKIAPTTQMQQALDQALVVQPALRPAAEAAGLTAEEKRDILSSTKNSLDYETIAAAPQTLWDDQLLGQRHRHLAEHQAHYTEHQDAFNVNYQDGWRQYEGSGWHDGYHIDGGYGDYGDGGWWYDEWDGDYEGQQAEAVVDPSENDDQVKDAQKAEAIGENLAMEANRTWTQAQRATQALRRDRGFGAVSLGKGGKNHGATKCFVCGGPHLARDCPDRRHPTYKGMKGKFGSYTMDMDDDYGYGYFIGKGKGGTKGKGKRVMWMDNQAWMKGKGKNRGAKSSSKDANRSANAYMSHYFIGGLEVSDTMELNSASAKPRGLISAILSKDKTARIELDQSAAPTIDPEEILSAALKAKGQGGSKRSPYQDQPMAMLLYTPRKGAPANSTESLNHPTVKKMLDDLHVLLGETRPTAQVCHYMMQKLTAEAVLNKAVTELLSGTGTMNPTTATTKAPGSSSTPALATPSSASWEALQDEELIQAYENEADAY
ncbi:unnamed protein product [Symbiodinium sp. KB8]|nr:unnamed protein product [Symbiodinium sp. KB8]